MGVIWIVSSRNVLVLFHDRQSRGHLSFFFPFNFLGSVLVLPFNMF
jgi:hypothetical protein